MPQASHRAVIAAHASARPRAASPNHQRELRIKVLWIDTNSGLAGRAVEDLSSGGCDVEVTLEAGRGLLRARQEAFDLIIIFLGPHGASGLHALQDLRTSGVMTPVLVLSADGDPALAFEIGHVGAVAYERAPIVASKLLAAVRQAAASVSAGGPAAWPPSAHCPASERLARVAVAASRHPSDWRSFEALAEIVGVGYGTLRAWCLSARVSGRAFNRFCRIFRAVNLASQTGVRPADLLDVVEPSTVSALFRAAGIDEEETNLQRFCLRQMLLPRSAHVAEIALSLLPQQ